MRYVLFVPAIICLALCGCGDSGGEVSGTVTLDGEPLSGATVEFTPKGGGRPAMGETNEKGKFKLEYLVDQPELPEGEYIVRITTATSKEDEEGNTVEIPERVPEKYNANSELKVKVPGGDYNFDLKSDS